MNVTQFFINTKDTITAVWRAMTRADLPEDVLSDIEAS